MVAQARGTHVSLVGMSHRWTNILVLGAMAAGIAAPQSISPDLQKYLNLTDAQVQSITDLDTQFGQYVSKQQTMYYDLQSKAYNELSKDSPDPTAVGDVYAQMEMIRRDYRGQLAQVQSKVGALLTVDQAMLVNGLLSVLRLQPLVSEAQCAHLESSIPTLAQRSGDFGVPISVPIPVSGLVPVITLQPNLVTSPCQVPPMPTALTNYLNLTDTQIIAIENAILGNQDFISRQALKIAELQNEIKDLTAAQTIDSTKLGEDYLAIMQIQKDEATQTGQLTTTVRSVLNDQQQPLLQALDNAIKLSFVASQAVGVNILVLPPDLPCPTLAFNAFPIAVLVPFPLPVGIPTIPFPSNSCGTLGGVFVGLPRPVLGSGA
jgi:hypothetical protein